MSSEESVNTLVFAIHNDTTAHQSIELNGIGDKGMTNILNRRERPRRSEDQRFARKERELDAARRITEALFQRLTTEEVLRMALRTALEIVDAECGSILLADSKVKQLVFRHSIGGSPVPA